MKEELREWQNGLLVSIRHSIERIKGNILSERDRTSFANMLLQFAQAVMKDPEYMKEVSMRETTDNILGAIDALMNSDADSLDKYYDALIQLSVYGEIVNKPEDFERFKPREDGRTYIDFLPKEMTNEQSFQIVEHLKSIGAKFDPEVGQWYVEKDWQMPKLEQVKEKENMDKGKENGRIQERERFKAYYYDAEGNRQEVLGETKEGVIQTVKEVKPELKETDRCYIQEYNKEEKKYYPEGIYLIETGKDVTPIKLTLPYMCKETFDSVKTEIKGMGVKFNGNQKTWYVERGEGHDAINAIKDCLQQHDEGIYLKLPERISTERFKAIVEQFRQDGARYNPDKKAWYITDKDDRSKFSDYLSSEKSSVLGKIEQNKNLAAEQSKNNGKIQERNKDNNERA